MSIGQRYHPTLMTGNEGGEGEALTTSPRQPTGGLVPASSARRIVWFWRGAKVGQAGTEVPDLWGLTDVACRRVLAKPSRTGTFLILLAKG